MFMTQRTQDTRAWGWFLALGVSLLIAGAGIASAPFFSTLVVEHLAGWVFLFGGLFAILQVFRAGKDWDAKITYLVLGGINALGGIFILLRPLEGLLALTILAITAIFVTGLVRILVGIQSRPDEGSGLVIFSGCVSVLVSSWLFWIYPEISAVLLGIVFGLSMIGEGAGYIRMAFGLKTAQE